MLTHFVSQFAAVYDRVFHARNLERLEMATLVAACLGFFAHLLVIFIARQLELGENALIPGLDRYYLDAIYTPFSFILFYEVLLLVETIPKSLTSSIVKQYEIISLIVVRGVFKDIGKFHDVEHWTEQTEAITTLLMDMGAAAVMFLLVTVFYHIRRKVSTSQVSNLQTFLDLKKAVALILSAILVGLAVYSLVTWGWSVGVSFNNGEYELGDVDLIFFPEFFELMIFTDVFLLIVSFAVFHEYHYVFRNAGFIISTILLRFSLTAPKPLDLGVALLAMVFGLIILGIFNYFATITSTNEVLPEAPEEESEPA